MYVHFSCIRIHIIYSISGIYTNTQKPNERRLQRLYACLLQSYGEDTRSMYTRKPLHSKKANTATALYFYIPDTFFQQAYFFCIFLSFLLILNLSIKWFLILYHFTIGGSGENALICWSLMPYSDPGLVVHCLLYCSVIWQGKRTLN